MGVADRCSHLKPSPTLAIAAKAKKLRAEGVDVISFGAGEPDFDTPAFVKDAAIDALQQGQTKYTATPGIPELREAIAAKFWQDNHVRYKPSQIAVGVGAKHCLFNALMALCNPGDEVILIAPHWPTYREQVLLAEGVPVLVRVSAETGFEPNRDLIRRAITNRTKAIIVNSPSNPTGAVFGRQTMKDIAALAIQFDFWMITDEIYEKMLYDGAEHVSIAALGSEAYERTVTINGLSKSHAMTGWRIGFCGAPQPIADAISVIQDQVTSNACSFAQWGALAALTTDDASVNSMRTAFDERRRLLVERLNAIPGFRCELPKGAFYALPNVSSLLGKAGIHDSCALAEYLLEQACVAVVPGDAFEAPEHIRLSYATDLQSIDEGTRRIREAVAKVV